MSNKQDFFSRFARSAAREAGRPLIFGCALFIILLWLIAGPVFHFSDTWQLVINTGTTIITFLMVFLIQNTQNRDSEAMHLKLDEIIRSSSAHNALLDIEELSEKQLDIIKVEYTELAREARPNLPKEPAVKPARTRTKKALPPKVATKTTPSRMGTKRTRAGKKFGIPL